MNASEHRSRSLEILSLLLIPPVARRVRSARCLSAFENGFAAGWFFPVPSAFRRPLDIQWSPRLKRWTQGGSFNFERGDRFWNHLAGHWGSRRDPAITYRIQVLDSAPASRTWLHPFIDYGFVTFDLLHLDQVLGAEAPLFEMKTLTQYEFVRLLITGEGIPDLP